MTYNATAPLTTPYPNDRYRPDLGLCEGPTPVHPLPTVAPWDGLLGSMMGCGSSPHISRHSRRLNLFGPCGRTITLERLSHEPDLMRPERALWIGSPCGATLSLIVLCPTRAVDSSQVMQLSKEGTNLFTLLRRTVGW